MFSKIGATVDAFIARLIICYVYLKEMVSPKLLPALK